MSLVTSAATREEMNSRSRSAKLESGWFMRCLFAGWFSATAGRHNSNIRRLGKGDCLNWNQGTRH
ncbi:MAG TPA: hypothetical protein VNN22_23250 [Verrucomicrobiae bacterium]|nr:hypothetical protein [Verrucomicrobiae bacterium]